MQSRVSEELAYVMTTSGTTGLPKIVRVPHCCIIPNIVDLRYICRLCMYILTHTNILHCDIILFSCVRMYHK